MAKEEAKAAAAPEAKPAKPEPKYGPVEITIATKGKVGDGVQFSIDVMLRTLTKWGFAIEKQEGSGSGGTRSVSLTARLGDNQPAPKE